MNTTKMTHPVVDQMIEVELVNKNAEDDQRNVYGFRKVTETLTRMGLMNDHKKIIYQSAHLLHKQGRFYICHFKELYMLDGRTATFSDEDRARRNRIAMMLESWGLIRIIDREKVEQNPGHVGMVGVLKYSDKDDWTLKAKYNIGQRG